MKIGILTFHKSINNGAVMQCYSLCKRLKDEFPDADVEVIDYHMPKIERNYEVSFLNYFRGCNLIMFIKFLIILLLNPNMFSWQRERKRAFKSVIDIMPLSNKKIYSDDTKELFEYINNEYDVVIAGSDAIWNYNVRGFPNPYFLDDSIKSIKLSYAASCYGMNYENISTHQKEKICRILDTYHLLGARDNESVQFVHAMGSDKQVIHTCDPTVFLDVDKLPIDTDRLVKKLNFKGFDFNKVTIGIMGTESMCKMVRNFYGDKYQIVSLYNYCKGADVNLHDLTPYEWAYVFRYFKLTFTTYFHGTLLSMRNGTPVICIALETDYSQKHMTKVEDFLIRVGLEHCYFHTDYKKSNLAAIKTMADSLLEQDLRSDICRRMDDEAQSADVFMDKLRCLINELEEENVRG